MITKVEAIKRVLEENGGVGTWKQIYDNIEKYYPPAKASIAWREGIRGILYRELRNNRNFKKIGLGIFALREYEEEPKPALEEKKRVHPFMEGICLELGNSHNFETYTPDRSEVYKDKIFLNQIATLKQLPEFTYKEIRDVVKRIDVMWFNKKGFLFPQRAFEIVDSIGTLSEALNRCLQLKYFKTRFYVLAPERYRVRFEAKIGKDPYLAFKGRFQFRNYQEIIGFYEQAVKYNELKRGFL